MSFTHDALPLFYDALGAVFQRHLVIVSHQRWTADDDGTVTRERTVGFADLVGSTEAIVATAPRELACLVRDFEALTWDVVNRAGGRLVKLIGDEAMFVFEEASAACTAALELSSRSTHPVGLVPGAVVGLHGDYYRVHDAAAGRESVDLGPLKGFADPVDSYSLRA